MKRILKSWTWMMLIFLVAWCPGCSSDSNSNSSNSTNEPYDFDPTPTYLQQDRQTEIKKLFPKEIYDVLTKVSRTYPDCKEDAEIQENVIPEAFRGKPNGEWYYTYEQIVSAMAAFLEFANEGNENTKKLEIAAFLANVAQETGGGEDLDATYGAPFCFITEGHGGYEHNCGYGGCTTEYPMDTIKCSETYNGECPDNGISYCGRGPHQLSWYANYLAYGRSMGAGDGYVKDPDLLTSDPAIGNAGSIWFWGHAVPGRKTDEPFKPSAHGVVLGACEPELADGWVPTAADERCGRTAANFGVIINIINGGLECGPNAGNPTAAKKRVKYLENICKLMNVKIPEGFATTCATQNNFAACLSYPDPVNRCGIDWADANSRCGQCCSSENDCPGDEKCWQTNTPSQGGLTCTCD
ncbi:MAG: hypothetical protein H8E10_12875 [Desulfobacterales bacterium]|nr:hypothetical protein [Desulfobacterales bacterium]MBL7205665.1 hypothetical protein [Desulfobacteraceae bacterium]